MILTQQIIDSVTRDESTGRWIVPDMDSREVFDQIVNLLKTKENFSFARYGDGEWNALFQDQKVGKTNCDGHEYFEDMGAALRRIVESKPMYMMGLQPLSIQSRGLQLNDVADGIQWLNSDTLHDASIEGYLDQFVSVLQDREVLLVAPQHISELTMFPNATHYMVASQNCWRYYGRDLEEIKSHVQADTVILLCCSMMAEVMIDDLYKYRRDITVIDAGSVFDPFVNVMSRSYHKKLKL